MEKEKEEKKKEEKIEKYPCPCNKAIKCIMDEPCLGCEVYAEWLVKESEDKHYCSPH